jgi:hypothetical protein
MMPAFRNSIHLMTKGEFLILDPSLPEPHGCV